MKDSLEDQDKVNSLNSQCAEQAIEQLINLLIFTRFEGFKQCPQVAILLELCSFGD